MGSLFSSEAEADSNGPTSSEVAQPTVSDTGSQAADIDVSISWSLGDRATLVLFRASLVHPNLLVCHLQLPLPAAYDAGFINEVSLHCSTSVWLFWRVTLRGLLQVCSSTVNLQPIVLLCRHVMAWPDLSLAGAGVPCSLVSVPPEQFRWRKRAEHWFHIRIYAQSQHQGCYVGAPCSASVLVGTPSFRVVSGSQPFVVQSWFPALTLIPGRATLASLRCWQSDGFGTFVWVAANVHVREWRISGNLSALARPAGRLSSSSFSFLFQHHLA